MLKFVATVVVLFLLSTTGFSEPKKKSPLLAASLSTVFFAGTGQFYNGDYLKGGIMLAIDIPVATFAAVSLIAFVASLHSDREGNLYIGDRDQDIAIAKSFFISYPAWLSYRIYSGVDAWRSAKRINKANLTLEPYVSHGARGAVLSLRF